MGSMTLKGPQPAEVGRMLLIIRSRPTLGKGSCVTVQSQPCRQPQITRKVIYNCSSRWIRPPPRLKIVQRAVCLELEFSLFFKDDIINLHWCTHHTTPPGWNNGHETAAFPIEKKKVIAMMIIHHFFSFDEPPTDVNHFNSSRHGFGHQRPMKLRVVTEIDQATTSLFFELLLEVARSPSWLKAVSRENFTFPFFFLLWIGFSRNFVLT